MNLSQPVKIRFWFVKFTFDSTSRMCSFLLKNKANAYEIQNNEIFCQVVVLSFQEKEKELELQRSMNQELDMALRLLEKDIHEKQDTVIQLRKQLDDIKSINLEMYNKLQVNKSALLSILTSSVTNWRI